MSMVSNITPMQKVPPSNDNTMQQETPLRELLNSRSREVPNLKITLNDESGSKDDFPAEVNNSNSIIGTETVNA